MPIDIFKGFFLHFLNRLYGVLSSCSRFFIVMTEGGETHVLSAVIADEHQINSRHATAACCIYGFARWHAQEEACIWTTDKTILIETSFVRDLPHGSTR